VPSSAVPSSFRSSHYIRLPASAICAAALLLLTACSHTEQKPLTMADIQAEKAAGYNFDAFLHLRPLAEQGNPAAQYELGYFYRMGTVGAADFAKARTWLLRSANQGNTSAMLQLAAMNGLGQGGPIDKQETVKWLTIAGNSHSLSPDLAAQVEQNRLKYADGLSPADLAAANDAAKAFQPHPESPSPTT